MFSTTKKIIHKISNLSKFNTEFTPGVLIQSIPWRVEFKKQIIGGDEWLNFFLWCEKSDELGEWARTASISVKLLPFEKSVDAVEFHSSPYTFGNSHSGIGITQFIKWNQLTNTKSGFVREDTIRLEIKITVTDPNDENKKIPKAMALDNFFENDGNVAFYLTVSNIGALMAIRTAEFKLRGLYWKISVFDNNSKWLGIRLETIEGENNDLQVTAKKDDPKTNEHVLNKNTSRQDVMEESEFISWKELFDHRNGFIRDNAIVLEVEMIYKQPINDRRKEMKRQMECDRSECAKLLKLECPICMEGIRYQDVSSLPCTHLFCTKCIEGAIRSRKRCPVCNAAAKLSDLRHTRLPL